MDVRLKEVCVDACLVVKLVINEPDSALADALFAWWQEQGVQLIAHRQP
jgi:predicted nucleic acid-binding protein